MQAAPDVQAEDAEVGGPDQTTGTQTLAIEVPES